VRIRRSLAGKNNEGRIVEKIKEKKERIRKEWEE
jgi:hypothetical protein